MSRPISGVFLCSVLALSTRAVVQGAPAAALADTSPAAHAAAPAAPADTSPVAHAAAPAANPQATSASTPRTLPAGRFGTVTVYIPEGTPQSVALFLSGDGGWQLGVTSMARALQDNGAVVIGVDVRRYLASLRVAAQKPAAPCTSLAGDFETLSHRIQKNLGLAEYRVPVLVGYSSGATVVYATLVQSPPGTFEGAISLGFCSDQDFGGALLCPGNGLRFSPGQKGEIIIQPQQSLAQPWIALQGQKDQVCSPAEVDAFAAASGDSKVVKLPTVGHGFSVERNWLPQFLESYRSIVAGQEARRTARPAEIDDLPVTEVSATNDTGQAFALLLTGDGGWAGLDQELAARLAQEGVPTVGLNSLKYFWTQRPPAQAANDVARVIRHYLAAWNKTRVLLVGYSFGADALPFIVNRLPVDLKQAIQSVSLLGISANASFEIRVADWIGSDTDGPPTRPELATLVSSGQFNGQLSGNGARVLCLYGEGDKDTICPELSTRVTRLAIGKGHHFSGEYSTIADKILAFARATPPAT
jgi:type IV secretory pathway VirJ component